MASKLDDIVTRVRKTICDTYTAGGGHTVEGRISARDFEDLIGMIISAKHEERQQCAYLFESVNPASDDERHNKVPGAGAMGAVIEFRDLIRARA